MKLFILLCMILFSSTLVKAQMHKVTIFGTVDPIGRVDYYSLKKVLPDSIVHKELIDPKRKFGIKDNYKVFLYLVENGWRLVNAEALPPTTPLYYHLSKEILLDDAAYEIYIEKIKSRN